MKKNAIVLILTASLSVCFSFSVFSQPYDTPQFKGTWLGTIAVNEQVNLRIGFIVSSDDAMKYAATMNIIEQKAYDIPMDSVLINQNTIDIHFSAADIHYKGCYDAETNQVIGQYQQGQTQLELNLSKVDSLPKTVIRTQIPEPPYPYQISDINFQGGLPTVELAGTMTYPSQGSQLPAVILIHGSGSTDRNETGMGHFHLLADVLTRAGFVVLRYDKRGIGESSGDYNQATTYDFAADAAAGIQYLKSQRLVDVNPKAIGIIGHSEGTLIAPMIAAEHHDIRFIVLLGAMGTNGGEIRLQQTEVIQKMNGVPEDEIQANLDEIAGYQEILLSDVSETEKRALIKKSFPKLDEGLLNYILKPWYRTFISLEPTDYLKQVTCPVLVLTGEKDVQCPPEMNLSEIKAALDSSGHQDHLIETLPSLNHLLQTADSGLPFEYDQIAEIIAPAALERITQWVLNNI